MATEFKKYPQEIRDWIKDFRDHTDTKTTDKARMMVLCEAVRMMRRAFFEAQSGCAKPESQG